MRRTKNPKGVISKRRVEELVEVLAGNRLARDSFYQFLLRIGTVHEAMAGAFMARDNQTEKQISGQDNQAPERVNTVLVSLDALKQRENAAQRNIELWEKAGVPSKAVRDILYEFNPDRKRFILETAAQYTELILTFKKQRQACLEMARLTEGLFLLPVLLRANIRQATTAGVDLCTTMLTQLAVAGKIIDEAKREFANARNLSRKAVAGALMQLRAKHVQEGNSTCSQRVADLLLQWDPEGSWNPNSLRANYSPRS